MSNPLQDLQAQCQGLLNDDLSTSDFPQPVWDSCILTALGEMTAYRPLQKWTDPIDIAPEDISFELPADFVEIDVRSFDKAVNPFPGYYSYQSYIFTLDSATLAASDLKSLMIGNPGPFDFRTVFTVTDDGIGGKTMRITPGAILATTIQFMYLSSQGVTDSINSIPTADRYLLPYKVCELVCMFTARLLVGDGGKRNLSDQYMKVAGYFRDRFEDRTKFRPIGMLA